MSQKYFRLDCFLTASWRASSSSVSMDQEFVLKLGTQDPERLNSRGGTIWLKVLLFGRTREVVWRQGVFNFANMEC